MRVTVTTNANQYAATMRAKAAALNRGVYSASRDIARVAKARADWWSSGPYSQRALTRMGHPYARRNTWQATGSSLKTRKVWKRTVYARRVGQGFPHRVNVQSGDFRSDWRTRVATTADAVSVRLENRSAHARYLTPRGTARMMGRDPMGAITRDVRKRTQGLWRKALRKALNTRAAGPWRGADTVTLSGWGLRDAFQRGYEFTRGL